MSLQLAFKIVKLYMTDFNSKKNKKHSCLLCCFPSRNSDPIVITIQAFLQGNEVVPLSMTHQSLYVNVETQVAIAGIILAGVYVLIIFEVNVIFVLYDE